MKRISAVLIALTIAANAYALSGAPKPTNPPHPVVNVNTATEAQYAMLPGVGPKLAAELYKIAEAGFYIYDPAYFDQKAQRWIKNPASTCDHRCHFAAVADLLKVKGIGPGKLAKMLPYVVLNGATTATVKITVAKVNGLTFKAPAAAPKPVGKSRCAQLGARCAG